MPYEPDFRPDPDDFGEWQAEQYERGNLADQSAQALTENDFPDPSAWTAGHLLGVTDGESTSWSIEILDDAGNTHVIDVGVHDGELPPWVWDIYDFSRIFIDFDVDYQEVAA